MSSAQVQGTLLDVLKKKMRQTKEEMEKYKDECEDYHKRLQVEVLRREEVSLSLSVCLFLSFSGRGGGGGLKCTHNFRGVCESHSHNLFFFSLLYSLSLPSSGFFCTCGGARDSPHRWPLLGLSYMGDFF